MTNKDQAIAKAADKREELRGFTLASLLDMIGQVERGQKLLGGHHHPKLEPMTQAATVVAQMLYAEVERRHPEASEFMDDWATNDDMADPVAHMSYGEALAYWVHENVPDWRNR